MCFALHILILFPEEGGGNGSQVFAPYVCPALCKSPAVWMEIVVRTQFNFECHCYLLLCPGCLKGTVCQAWAQKYEVGLTFTLILQIRIPSQFPEVIK
jgi:hypothetical protein